MSPGTWSRVATGFVSFGAVPQGADWVKLGGFAAYAGAGGAIDGGISNWFRVFLGLHTLYINRKFLPPALRPPLWREIVVVLGVVFFAFFFLQRRARYY